MVDFGDVQELRARVSRRVSREDDGRFDGLDADSQRQRLRAVASDELEGWLLERQQQGRPELGLEAEDDLIDAVLDALGGLGRLEPLLRREDVEDIYFTGCEPTVLRLSDGRKVPGPPIASTDQELSRLLQSLGTGMDGSGSREFSTARPLLSMRLREVGTLGARLSAATDVVPRPAGTIRVHRHVEADLDRAYELGMIDAPLRALLRAAVLAGAKIAITGAPAAGKTFLLRALASEIPLDAMIVTVEDDRELGLHLLPQRDAQGIVRDEHGHPVPRRHPALVRPYEARLANAEGVGKIDMGDLLWQSLRDSADIIIVGETRAGDIVHLLDAATNGIAGVMCTLHATSAEAVFDRIVQLVLKAQPPLPSEYALRASTALDLIVHVARNRAHERYVSQVVEVHSGYLGEHGLPVTERLFASRADGRAVPTGQRPTPELLARLSEVGFEPGWLQPLHSDWDRPGPAVKGGRS